MREINLLPLARKKTLQQEESLLLLTRLVWWVAIGMVVITVGGLGLLAFFRFVPRSTDVATPVEQQLREVRSELRTGQLLLEWIQRHDVQRVVWSQRLPELLSRLPQNVAVHYLEANGSQQLVIGGLASHRSVLTSLREKLDSLAWVANVEAPLSNLLVADNPSFRFTVHLAEQQPAQAETGAAVVETSLSVSDTERSPDQSRRLSLLQWAGIVLMAGGFLLLGGIGIVWAVRQWQSKRWKS